MSGLSIFSNQATWNKGCFNLHGRMFQFLHAVFEGAEVISSVNDRSRSNLFKSKGPVDCRVPASKDSYLLSLVLLDVWNVVVNIFKVFSPFNVKGTWLKGSTTHGNHNCFWQMLLARSSDSENIVLFLNPLYGFIEEDRSVESFHLLDQTVTQLLTC